MKIKFDIKHRITAALMFSRETESLRLCVEAAVTAGVNLCGADLCGADLRGADLRAANLRGADLCGADLYAANLRAANLYAANLRGANLRGADLCGADLYAANLRAANLYAANLRGANLHGADLCGVDLYAANLRAANLYAANLRKADLCGADLRGAFLEFEGKKLTLVGERPVFQIGPIGSRNSVFVAFLTDVGVFVRAGCFFDTLTKFAAEVKAEHGTNVHAEEYAAAITTVKMHKKLWTPKDAV
jgi:hypothetical protein